MKKTLVMIAVIVLVVTVSVGAYAHYENSGRRGGWMRYGAQNPQMTPQQGSMYGPRGGMMHGQRGSMMTGPHGGMMAGPGYQGNVTPENCPCGRGYGWNTWKNQQATTAPQMVTEEQAKAAAEEYVQKYLSGYTVATIEKDAWRPLYLVTIKGANDVEQQMLIHGFGGQVMHVFPKTAE
ncbi:hypothetical protein U27_03679 [Candidatus Vecturithrix granuli]|uniref:PepSY domain-containing protein n=1 Tax=Vecturithrix granuli TaxID=1499967 RepID=A0A081BWL1_VECG1|nr:hypothetical protein U27_03679 [Candidatus Vecturithrix granuli]